MTRILIVDDHPVFRRGLAFLLETTGHEVVGEAASGTEALTAVRELRPELVVLDMGLPELHGARVAASIRTEYPHVRIVAVTMYDDESTITQALEAGVDGYVLKDAAPEQILAAIEAAKCGARMLGSGVAMPPIPHTHEAISRHGFTTREREVAEMLTHGLSNRTIAGRLGVSEKTVANYVVSVRQKMGAASRYDAARMLREE